MTGPAGGTPRCGRPEGDDRCGRPLTPVPDAPAVLRCSRHGVATIVQWTDRPPDPRRRRVIGGRARAWKLGADLDAAIDARAARDGVSPGDALRAMLREHLAADEVDAPRVTPAAAPQRVTPSVPPS